MKTFITILLIGFVFADYYVERKQEHNHIKQAYLKRRTRQAQTNETPVEPVKVEVNNQQQPVTIPVPTNTNEVCTTEDCSGRGTCIGTKQSPICICQLGYAGTRCEDTYCDSARDCSNRGLCMGTQRQHSCLCNLGFSGPNCEFETTQTQTVVVQQTPPPAPSPTPASHNQAPSHNH